MVELREGSTGGSSHWEVHPWGLQRPILWLLSLLSVTRPENSQDTHSHCRDAPPKPMWTSGRKLSRKLKQLLLPQRCPHPLVFGDNDETQGLSCLRPLSRDTGATMVESGDITGSSVQALHPVTASG